MGGGSDGGVSCGQSAGSGGSSGGNDTGGSGGAAGDASDGTSQPIDADPYPALQIVQVQVLSGVSGVSGDCAVPNAPTSIRRSSGILDLALPDGSAPAYYLPVIVANNLEPALSPATTEMNNLTISHFTVELSAPNVTWSSACPATFDTVEATAFLAPGTTAGFGINVITPAHAQCLLPHVKAAPFIVTATISAKGRHGGTGISSDPFVFPIEVCAGCLQQGYSDPALKNYEYPADIPFCSMLSGVNPYAGDPCAPPGQDAKIFCCAVTTTWGGTPQDVVECPGVFAP